MSCFVLLPGGPTVEKVPAELEDEKDQKPDNPWMMIALCLGHAKVLGMGSHLHFYGEFGISGTSHRV